MAARSFKLILMAVLGVELSLSGAGAVTGSSAAAAVSPSAATPARPSLMTVEDLVALLKAGVGEKVILRQIEATGTRLTLTVEALLQLKAAGASDDLLEALVAPPAQIPGPAEAAAAAPSEVSRSPFRIYKEVSENGEAVMHITNLDASGKRIGGEIRDEERVPANVISRAENEPARRRKKDDGDAYRDEPEDRQAPVIVNVYPPEPAASGVSIVGGGYDPYESIYLGDRYPGYLGGYYPAHHNHGPYCSHAGYYPYLPSPPGSYSHFIRYHHSNRTLEGSQPFSRPRAIDIAPYSIGTAAARNRARFNRR